MAKMVMPGKRLVVKQGDMCISDQLGQVSSFTQGKSSDIASAECSGNAVKSRIILNDSKYDEKP